MVRPVVTISDAQIRRLAERAERTAAVRAYKIAEYGAEVMEREVVRIVSTELIPDRAPHRRKKGTTKLINSFQGRVVGARGQFPVTAKLTTKPGVSTAKIKAIEEGGEPHEISPGAAGVLRYPREAGPNARKWSNQKFRNAYGPNNFRTFNPVQHPGSDGIHMMRRARERALKAMKQYARTLR